MTGLYSWNMPWLFLDSSHRGRRYKIDCEPENFFRDGSFDAIVAQSFDLGRLWAADACMQAQKKRRIAA